ncbi:MAG: acyltransferase domain-containing protein, partial [Deltaproteobacteria bacterium]|nr:acyltransferase domain-containing protein [Deltaproteobacteria bacterium]
MEDNDTRARAIAIVGIGAVLPDAPSVPAFWRNLLDGRYSIADVDPARWDPALYFDADPAAPDKTYSKIGGFVREFPWDPMGWKLPIPPRVSDAMDDAQKWAIACTREALADYGWPKRPLDGERTAVILGNAMAGERHYQTALRISFPEYATTLAGTPTFQALPAAQRAAITAELRGGIGGRLPAISEDTMPGELANCMAGRLANLFNFHGPNFVVDAACASAMAAMAIAAEGLAAGDYDVAITGGIDRNMGAATYVKFCKIGALSATGTRPYADGADGFVMGEGAAIFVLKRLADAERDGDRIHAVVRGFGGASDGRGKGITAPNPVGQRLAIERAWGHAGLRPRAGLLVEGHGTSTRVGDVVEVQSLCEAFAPFGLAPRSVALGSVKSNIGHLKGAAGAAGMLKAVLALRERTLPASLHCETPNPAIDFARSPFAVQTAPAAWELRNGDVRRAAVSAFGFGGTDFHAVLEEHVPGRLAARATPRASAAASAPSSARNAAAASGAPLRGALVVGADTVAALDRRLVEIERAAVSGHAPPPAVPAAADLAAPERIAVDYGDAAELAGRIVKARQALAADHAGTWKALRAQGVFRGRGPTAKVAFLYTGQGSQYPNMLRALRADAPIVAATFGEADRVMAPILGGPLSAVVFCDPDDPARVAAADESLRQTAITQPAVLATDIALTRLLAAYGVAPDLVMGHSLGEYGALVAAGSLAFADALEAVSARGREMSAVAVGDNGRMAAVFAPLAEVERVLATVEGYAVVANVNSTSQSVIGGASEAIERAIAAFQAAGINAVAIPVSHAFHTEIVAPASVPLRRTLARLGVRSPAVPVVSNVTGDFYPTGPDVGPAMLDLLSRQVAAPVQFVRGLEALYAAGARVFVEVGPKRALQGFVDDVLGSREDVVSLFTNHPKLADAVAFNQALCGLYAAGLGAAAVEAAAPAPATPVRVPTPVACAAGPATPGGAPAAPADDRYRELGRLFASLLEPASRLLGGAPAGAGAPVVVSGAAVGLPGLPRIFDDANLGRLLHGEQLIDVIPTRFRRAMLDKHITRLVKREEGGPTFEAIEAAEDVIKLAARGGAFDLAAEFGVDAERLAALDTCTRLAIAAGIDALRDAGIPLIMGYRTTTTGGHLPTGWRLPESMRDDTGIVFASAFPGSDALVDELTRHHEDQTRRALVAELEHLRARAAAFGERHDTLIAELDRRIHEVQEEIARHPYRFDRRFLFRVLSMGHSQLAELIGARGPNTQVNAACASTTQAVALAEDWIRAGRCRRVIVVAADDVTSDRLLEWVGAGFLATGAAATDEDVASAAVPFDRRRHGMIVGMGAAAMVIEAPEALRERGLAPICEVLAAVTANSAFHGTRLDVGHIGGVMESLVADAERRWGVERRAMAPAMVFVSHETYTPARGGSAAAEVEALRRVFGADASRIVVANTKGLTGHPMGVGIEDVVAVKALETGLVPPVPNFREPDPDLGALNLSQGGCYPIEYALRLGAGFGSQISMSLLRRVPAPDGVRRAPEELGFRYRVADPARWEAWLGAAAGHGRVELEVAHHQLRVKDQGPPARVVVRAAGAASAPSAAPPLSAPARAPAASGTGAAAVSAAAGGADPVAERI